MNCGFVGSALKAACKASKSLVRRSFLTNAPLTLFLFPPACPSDNSCDQASCSLPSWVASDHTRRRSVSMWSTVRRIAAQPITD